jgi:HNH endonuclease
MQLNCQPVRSRLSQKDSTCGVALQDIIRIGKKEARCFSFQLKEALFNSNNTCAICGQWIQKIDDSAVDHVKQYWTGGQTIPENARLTHRYCNWARSRRDREANPKRFSTQIDPGCAFIPLEWTVRGPPVRLRVQYGGQ